MATTQTSKDYFENWHPYEKLIQHNYMRHSEIIESLAAWAVHKSPDNFGILELGCGNAYVAPLAFGQLKEVHYTGVDLSGPALKVAHENLKQTGWDISLIEGDIEAVIEKIDTEFDLVFAGFSLHHFSQDSILRILEKVKTCLKETGELIVYDIVARENESRSDYVRRLVLGIETEEMGLDPDQFESIQHHIENYDFPVGLTVWESIGESAGFGGFECVYRDEKERYAVLRFSRPAGTTLED